ncbi:MAG: hypothetical protein ACYTGR_05765 [Planctomycetota bacterium]
MWSTADIADALEAGIACAAASLDVEQAVMGLDARDEVELHPVLADSLHEAGYGVAREQRYPADRRKRKGSEGERCDLVLTPESRPLVESDAGETLFAAPDAVDIDEAFWLEVKVVHQYLQEGANANYSSQLLSTVRGDVTKLSKAEDILHAGLLIMLFVATPMIAEHDLGIWQDKCLERSLPIAAPSVRHVELANRLGHACCTLALYPVSHL